MLHAVIAIRDKMIEDLYKLVNDGCRMFTLQGYKVSYLQSNSIMS